MITVTAPSILRFLSSQYQIAGQAGDGRAAHVASTLDQLADVLDASGGHTADALRTYFQCATRAQDQGRNPAAAEARRNTARELLRLLGEPLDRDYAGALAIGEVLEAHFRATDDPRSQAMAATFAAETGAVRECLA